MIVEDFRRVEAGAVLRAQVCIIGGGPAGLTLAEELSAIEGRVVLLESGLRTPTGEVDDLNEIESIGAARVIDQILVRNRQLGGTSATWSGRSAVFDEMDFRERKWVAHSGWPISRQSLESYFARSTTYLGLGVADNVLHPPAGIASPPGDETLRPYVWSYSSNPNGARDFRRFGDTDFARDDRPDSVHGYLGATVTQLETTTTGSRITGVEVRGLDGLVRRVEADVVVLCAGGIENARILLASNRIIAAGIGNSHDVVGRYLADHPRGPVGHFDPHMARSVQEMFAGHQTRVGGHRFTFTSGFALTEEVQRDEELVNCSMWLSDARHPDDPFTSLSDLLRRRGNRRHHLSNIIQGRGDLLRGARDYLLHHRSPVRRVEMLSVQVMAEQQPDPDSRVTLAERTDAFGMPLARLDWRIGDAETRTIRRAAHLFSDRMRELGLPEPVLDPMITDPTQPFWLPDVAHPSGTTRMSDNPATGVVDRNCRVHDVDNLYIAGSSVFPTNGHANPTQMIVALAIRLADHLKHLIAAPPGRDAEALDQSRSRKRSRSLRWHVAL